MASGVPKTGGTPLSSCSSLQERSLVRQDCCRFLSPVSLKVLARKGIELLGIASEGVYLIAHDETVGPVALGAHALTGVINIDLFGNHVFLSADRGGDCFCKVCGAPKYAPTRNENRLVGISGGIDVTPLVFAVMAPDWRGAARVHSELTVRRAG